MFLGEVPYQQRDLRRREDRRAYPMRVEFGLKGGFKLPPGLDSGQQVSFLLQRIALPYYGVTNFDELPTPFRCVATDMEKGVPVVLGSGSLSRAMRATMSLPTAFAPVVIDGQLLADGGILNNVPVDVARAHGADVVIAVNVGSAPHTREQMMSLFGMLGQTLDVAMSDSTRAIAATADVLVQPPVGAIGSLDWRKHEEIANLGYTGASAVPSLLKYAVDDATWKEWLSARAARRKTAPPSPEFVRFVGLSDTFDRSQMDELLKPFVGVPLDQEALGEALTRITGTGLFAAVTYDAIREDGRDGLLVHVDEKLTGPPLLNLAFEVSNRASKGLSFESGIPRHDVQHVDEELGDAPGRLVRHAPGRGRRTLPAIRLQPLFCRAERRRRASHHGIVRRRRGGGRVPSTAVHRDGRRRPSAERRQRAAGGIHLRARRGGARHRRRDPPGVRRSRAQHAHPLSTRRSDQRLCPIPRLAGDHAARVLGP